MRTFDRIPDLSKRDTDGDDLRSAGIPLDDDDNFFMPTPMDDFCESKLRLIRACGQYATARVHDCTKCMCDR